MKISGLLSWKSLTSLQFYETTQSNGEIVRPNLYVALQMKIIQTNLIRSNFRLLDDVTMAPVYTTNSIQTKLMQ